MTAKKCTPPTFVVIKRPDGQNLYLNVDQVIYVMADLLSSTGRRTEIVTAAGAFYMDKPVDEVLKILSGAQKGDD